MNLSNYSNLRWCDRHKNTQIYHHVQAFAKKIRKRKIFNEEEPINANAQQKEIDVFYKIGWEYEHAHSTMSCDISDPIYVQLSPEQALNQSNYKYYEECLKFIERLRTEHEDQTAFRVQTKYIEPIIKIDEEDWNSDTVSDKDKKHYQNLICARDTYINFIEAIQSVIKSMLSNIDRFSDIDPENYPYLKVFEVLETIKQWVECLKIDQTQIEPQSKQIQNVFTFVSNFIGVLQRMRNEGRSCLFNFQPQIQIFTHIIHPVLLGLYGYYQKEKIMWQNQYQHDILKINFHKKIQGSTLLADPPHFEISKTVFINLDGHQSEFNIEFAKNMSSHLMYVSFPKFDKPAEDSQLHFNNRYFKKLFFNYCREFYEFDSEEFDIIENKQMNGNVKVSDDYMEDEEEIDSRRKLQLQYDPEKYFESVTRMYKDKKIVQKNGNIFIIPISFKYLQQELSNLFMQKTEDASKHTSYFVWFLINDFLMEDIRKFKPKNIIISYNGNIAIKDEHFIKMIQQFATVTRRKVLLFPNFTTKLIDPTIQEEYQKYDNFVKQKKGIEDVFTIDMMRKFSQFLKISSGTYNLEQPKDKQSLIPRYKLAKLQNYIRGILNALSNQQYQHLRNRVSDLILRCESIIINKSVDENINQIRNSIPPYYQLLIRNIKDILIGEKLPAQIADLVDSIRSQMRSLQATNPEMIRGRYLNEIQQELQLEIASEKYSEVAYVYFRTKNSKKQFDELKQYMKPENETEIMINPNKKQSSNLNGLYALNLRYSNQHKQKLMLPVYDQSEIVYRVDQRYKITGKTKKTANIMLMNHLEQNQFISFAGLVNLSSEGESNKIITQRVQMYPIVFEGMPNLNNNFSIRVGWNYAETNKYYILYWPQCYNFLQAKLRKINDQIYEPPILNEIYVCEIPDSKDHRLSFAFTNAQEDIIPRRFCSSLELFNQNKIFIMGGFYTGAENYLNLQTQITGLDLSLYTNQHRKCILTNEKRTLFTELQTKAAQGTKINSFIRARREYEFYELQELCELNEEEKQEQNQYKTYVMIGGYGQDFIRPFSLINCNYYIINVDMQNKFIKSIEKKMAYQKVLTSNIKGFIKNNGYSEKLALYEQNCLKPDEYIGRDSYIAHRYVYALSRDDTKSQELLVKNKYFFALNLFTNFKKQYMKLATKIGEHIDTKTNDASQFFLSLSQQGNNYLIIRQNRNKEFITQIYLQKIQGKSTIQKVPLTHGSIISIDIRFKHIYALIMHELYTAGKYVLAQCEIPSEQSEAVLKIVHEFSINLFQHFLFSPRPHQILLLHGLPFDNVNISDYVIKIAKKQGNKDDQIKSIVFPNSIPSKQFKKCYTVMLKDENKQTKALEVESINIIFPNDNKPRCYWLKKYRLKLSTQLIQFVWEQIMQCPIVFVDENTKNLIHLVKIEETRQLHSHENMISQGGFTSPTVSAMIAKSKYGILIKAVSFNKQTYIGIINISLPEEDMGKDETIKVIMVNGNNKEVKKVWQMSNPLYSRTKTISIYLDMDIEVRDQPQ